ncbi:MAG TPA: hypothetical protein VLM85_33350 [Polyangiaceae bacterium]|nr:hypothetical protein [Polyangiaceae bacterium]
MDKIIQSCLVFAATVLLGSACGGGNAEQKETTPVAETPKNPELPPPSEDADASTSATAKAPEEPKKDPCTGFDMDLPTVLAQAACEVPNPKPDQKPVDMKGKLEVKLVASQATVAPGGHVDLQLTLTNKSNGPLPLFFTLDPMPRFPTEAYGAKGGKRVDMPAGNPPPLPKGVAPREATSHETARITLVQNGTARISVGWDAVKTKWAPEKLKGTPPEMGYPRAPSGPLAKGKYVVRVAMPLVQVFEGTDREISAPKTEITVH